MENSFLNYAEPGGFTAIPRRDSRPLSGWLRLLLTGLVFCIIAKPQVWSMALPSPLSFMVLVALVAYPSALKCYGKRVLVSPFEGLFWCGIFILVSMDVCGFIAPLVGGGDGISCKPVMTGSLLLVSLYGKLNHPEIIPVLFRALLWTLIGSVIWFFLTVLIPGLQSACSFIFPIQQSFDGEMSFFTGWAGASHIFPYHLAAVMAFSLVKYAYARAGRRIIWMGLAGMCVGAVFLQGGRSGLIALGVVAVLWLFWMRHRTRKLFLWGELIGLVLLVCFLGKPLFFDSGDEVETVAWRGNAVERLLSDNLLDERRERMDMQYYGLRIAAENPLGLPLSGKYWVREIISYMPHLSTRIKIYAVHNYFLGQFLNYGWLIGLLVIGMILGLIVKFFQADRRDICSERSSILGLALLGNLVNALTHNAGYYNEVSSYMMTVLLVLCLADDNETARRQEEKTAS